MPERLAVVHGAYYLATGIWPLVSMRTFELVTGRKTDRWLVRMVGLLAAVIGATLLRRGATPAGRAAAADPVLPVGAAIAFAAVDCVYVLRGTIRPVYLGDAAVEIALAAGWLRAASRA